MATKRSRANPRGPYHHGHGHGHVHVRDRVPGCGHLECDDDVIPAWETGMATTVLMGNVRGSPSELWSWLRAVRLRVGCEGTAALPY